MPDETTESVFGESPEQVIQHPLFFKLSFMNQIENKKITRTIIGTIKTPMLIDSPTKKHKSHKINVTHIPIIPCLGSNAYSFFTIS